MALNDPTRVLIGHFLPQIVSGAERSIADLVDALPGHFEVIMLVPGEGRLAEFYRERGLPVWTQAVSNQRRLYPWLHSWHSYLFSRRLQMAGIHLMIANTFAAASRYRTGARWAGVPLGIYVREIIPDRPLYREILDQAARVMVISKDLQQHVGAMTDPGHVRLTYNYIDPRPILDRAEVHRRTGQRKVPFERGMPVIGTVGRITPWKQQDVFIRAAAQVLRVAPEARFVIVGGAEEKDRPYERSLLELTRQLGVEEQVRFLGGRKDNIEITSELTISAMASTREPLGRVILEAHLVGVPVVVPDVGGPAEIVVPEETGLTFSPGAPDAANQLAAQILRLLRDPELRLRIKAAANRHVMNTFAGPAHIGVQQHIWEEMLMPADTQHKEVGDAVR